MLEEELWHVVYLMAGMLTIVGVVLLRLGGRKSISQMTFGTVLVTFSLGNLLVEPVTRANPRVALGTVITMLIALVLIEWVEMKSNLLETVFSGKAVPVIENGMIHEGNLKRLRLPVDKLEMRLRQHGIKRISDVKTATIEVNGSIGYELQRYAEPLTVGQFETAMQSLIPEIKTILQSQQAPEPNLFDETTSGLHKPHDKRLQ